jgi:hypothetical protein
MRIFITFLFVAWSFQSFACSCDWGGNFLKSASLSELVFKGKVLKRTFHLENGQKYSDQKIAYKALIESDMDQFYGMGESITIEVIEIIKGGETRKTFRIFDSDGADCRENTSNFVIGQSYIFSAYQLNREQPELPNETKNDYAIHGCSENWLEYLPETDQVKGRIRGKSPRKNRITYSYIKLVNEITEHNNS